MAGTKKRLKKLVAAVSEILGDQKKAKKLKKAEALERFIGKLEDKHREMESARSKGTLEGKAAEEQAHKTESLAKQIRKARKILSDMNKGDEE